MERPEGDRHEVLLAARALFRRRGVHATSMQQIAEASGVPRGSLAYHYPRGKAQLVREVVGYSATELSEAIRAGLGSSDHPADVFRCMTGMIGAVLEYSGWWEGCPIATVALELSDDDPATREACRRGFELMDAAMFEAFTGLGIDHDEAADLVMLVSSGIEGALVRSRLARSTEPLDRMTRQVGRVLDARIAEARAAV